MNLLKRIVNCGLVVLALGITAGATPMKMPQVDLSATPAPGRGFDGGCNYCTSQLEGPEGPYQFMFGNPCASGTAPECSVCPDHPGGIPEDCTGEYGFQGIDMCRACPATMPDIEPLLAANDMDQLRSLVRTDPSVSVNESRSAIQVTSPCNGQVVVSIPIDRTLMQGLLH